MTDYPCIADTDSIALLLDPTFRANLEIDPDATNALAIDASNGLYAAQGVIDCARVYRTAAQAMSTGGIISMGSSATRWDSTAGRMTVGANLVTTRNGLWVVGASVAFDVGAAVGQAFCTINAGIYGAIALDSASSAAAAAYSVASVQEFALHPCAIAEIGSGVTLEVQVFHNFGGTINTVGSSTPPTAGAGCEFSGCELWAACVRPL